MEGRIAGCLSDAVFMVRGGYLAVQGRTPDHAVVFHESLESLAGTRQAGARIWLKRVVYRAGPEEVHTTLFLPQGKGYETMPYLGELQVNTSDFQWHFPALDEGGAALDGEMKLHFRFNLLDAR
ncbi:hypothetical protein [Marimonas arenosa]|uniref:Uncharacterized protein n=1 Tax=Marimonas arenosa TaxID=1795305 RepID=A0AAE3WCC3_9RHOB|nr:hypothetical protein [Marimonas arenosa]MDQ2089080.1 hypothetical protein [Marimonas arenosa]